MWANILSYQTDAMTTLIVDLFLIALNKAITISVLSKDPLYPIVSESLDVISVLSFLCF